MLMPATPKADLVEIFSSFQGEGLLVGCRQAFIRFPDCNLDCDYCDTDFSRKPVCRVETEPGSNVFALWPNPVTLEQVGELFRTWRKNYPGAHHSISLTGGEPLLHAELLRGWLPELKRLWPVCLETNGTLPEALDNLIDHLDWVAMDIKLHSQTGERTDWEAHRAFLNRSRRVNCYVKVVVGPNTPELELQLVGDLMAGIDKSIPLVLQPVTVNGSINLTGVELIRMQNIIADSHPNVRVVPQNHIILNML